MTTIYKASFVFVPKLEELLLVRRTSSYVTIMRDGYSKREAISSRDHLYCDTWAEAHAWLQQTAWHRLAAANRRLDAAKQHLAAVADMEAPDEP